jgi:hypothetical protein
MELRAKLPSLRTHFQGLAFDSFGRQRVGTPESNNAGGSTERKDPLHAVVTVAVMVKAKCSWLKVFESFALFKRQVKIT